MADQHSPQEREEQRWPERVSLSAMTNAMRVFPDEQDDDRIQVRRVYVLESALQDREAEVERVRKHHADDMAVAVKRIEGLEARANRAEAALETRSKERDSLLLQREALRKTEGGGLLPLPNVEDTSIEDREPEEQQQVGSRWPTRPIDESYEPERGDVLLVLSHAADCPPKGAAVAVDAIFKSGRRWTSINVGDGEGGRWSLTPSKVIGRMALHSRGLFDAYLFGTTTKPPAPCSDRLADEVIAEQDRERVALEVGISRALQEFDIRGQALEAVQTTDRQGWRDAAVLLRAEIDAASDRASTQGGDADAECAGDNQTRVPGRHVTRGEPEPDGRLAPEISREQAVRVVVDFLDGWRHCPVSTASAPSHSCLEDAAKQLVDALQPPAPVPSGASGDWPPEIHVGRVYPGARPYISDNPDWTRANFELRKYVPAESGGAG